MLKLPQITVVICILSRLSTKFDPCLLPFLKKGDNVTSHHLHAQSSAAYDVTYGILSLACWYAGLHNSHHMLCMSVTCWGRV